MEQKARLDKECWNALWTQVINSQSACLLSYSDNSKLPKAVFTYMKWRVVNEKWKIKNKRNIRNRKIT